MLASHYSSMVKNREKTMKKQSKSTILPRFGCLKIDDESPTVDRKNSDGSIDMVSAGPLQDRKHPTHLIVMVNGIIGSSEDWKYAAKQFLKAYPQQVIVHCSERNTSTLTFDGIDIMGERLADEVVSVRQRYPHLCKISFIGHSLGGLIARYAIALLYGENYLKRLLKLKEENGKSNVNANVLHEDEYIGKIAGLEPMNFITFATPHLGSRGHNQVPMFCGFHTLEIAARQLSWFLGRTGRHLFLTDQDRGMPPLLLKMASDFEGLPFISALKSFSRRVAYANVRFDQLVGWCTSSLRLEDDLPKGRYVPKNSKYRHIVNEETGVLPAPRRISTLESIMFGWKKIRTRDMMEEMLRGLTTLSWERVDVKFGGGKHRLMAHNSIQVQTYCVHSAGADVIHHMIDNFIV